MVVAVSKRGKHSNCLFIREAYFISVSYTSRLLFVYNSTELQLTSVRGVQCDSHTLQDRWFVGSRRDLNLVTSHLASSASS